MGLIASEQGLEIIDRARRKKFWVCQAHIWYETANVSLATLRRFRGGKEKIGQESFESICKAVGIENWQQIVDWEKSGQNRVENNYDSTQIYHQEDCDDMPDVYVFYGREKELDKSKQLILQKRSRVIVFCGQPGIGKTTLAGKLAEEVKSDFDYFIWRSLNNSPPPTLLKLLSDLIEFFLVEKRLTYVTILVI